MNLTDLVNRVRAHLGEPPAASSASTDATTQMIVASWPSHAESLLSIHPWNFATVTEPLAVLAGVEPVGYKYAYAKPAGCLRILAVSLTSQREDPGVRYIDHGGQIWADAQDLYIRFISSTYKEQIGLWPAPVFDALALRIALVQAPIQTQSRGKLGDIESMERRMLRQAKSWDALQMPSYELPPGRFVRARYSYRRGHQENGGY